MRPGVSFDAEFALQNLDKRLSACGIKTFCHAISFADDELVLSSSEKAEDLVRLICQYSRGWNSTLSHKIHARYEIGARGGVEILFLKEIPRLWSEISAYFCHHGCLTES
jgi:alpha-D-ribose 1-methylphosphonate 5-triphosphate diphosphatase